MVSVEARARTWLKRDRKKRTSVVGNRPDINDLVDNEAMMKVTREL
jgi:hypothetical protein